MKQVLNNEFYTINKNVGIEIKGKDEFEENDIKLLELSQLNIYDNIEAWTALGTSQELGYFTHGFFRYFGKFPPVIATHLITEYSEKNDVIFDPMCGSGTTGVEALYLGRKAYVNDINDLSVLLAKVKTTHLDKEILSNELERIKEEYKPLTLKEYNYEPKGLKDYKHWFLDETCNSLRGLKKIINTIDDEDVRNFFLANFCAIVRPVSRATTQQGRLFLDVETAKKDALESFIKKTTKNIEAVDNLIDKKSVTVLSRDIIKDDFPEISKVKLIIMHPPYFNSYKYSSINSLELSWLGVDKKDFAKKEIHEFFKRGQAENVDRYVQDMYDSIVNMSKYMSKNGRIALMIGDTVIKNEYVPTTKLLLNKLEEQTELMVEKVILRIPKYTEASWAASQRRKSNDVGININDFIIILKEK